MNEEQDDPRRAQWQPWINLFRELVNLRFGFSSLSDILEEVPKSLRRLVALAFSCAKWYPDERLATEYWLDCALCRLYLHNEEADEDSSTLKCSKCPLDRANECCLRDESAFAVWHTARENRAAAEGRESLEALDEKREKERRAAERMFDVLMSCYRKEYERIYGTRPATE